MSNTIQRSNRRKTATPVTPSRSKPDSHKPFSLEQELTPFGDWVDESIWVPPKDSSTAMAQTVLKEFGPFTPADERWDAVVQAHRSEFTHVREIEMRKASIRLPKGRFFVELTEPENFDKITDEIPACVQTRLDEFMAGPGKQPGVKVHYLKPLCVEVGDDLIFTSRDDLMAAITKIQTEVFSEYRRLYVRGMPRRVAARAFNLAIAVPKNMMNSYLEKKQKAIDAYHAKLEFRRRRIAHRAAKNHRRCFTTGCTFDEMNELSGPLEREKVIEQFCIEQELSRAERDRLLRIAAGTLPWFVTLSVAGASFMSLTVMAASPVVVCDPAFVAEMPDAPGVLLKIGHFDEIGGITHVEI